MSSIVRSRVLSSAILTALLLVMTSPAVIAGEDGAPAAQHGPLDGMSFVGTLGPEGKPGDRDDIIHFDNGQFWSENCVPCGFPPGPYWVRYAEDGVYFRGELQSPTNGSFRYKGSVKGDRLAVTMSWRKQRWYWSIERDFWFEGTLVDAGTASAPQSAAGVALAAASGPVRVCEP